MTRSSVRIPAGGQPFLDMDPGHGEAGVTLRVPEYVLEEGLGQLWGHVALRPRYRPENLAGGGGLK